MEHNLVSNVENVTNVFCNIGRLLSCVVKFLTSNLCMEAVNSDYVQKKLVGRNLTGVICPCCCVYSPTS